MRKIYSLILSMILLCTITAAYSSAQNKNNFNNKTAKINSPLPASIGDVTVKTWADNKKSAYSFSFDDGFQSQYDNVRPILNSFGFHATFFLISSALVNTPPYIYRYGSWPEFQQIAAEGNEIGDHTVTHPDLTKLSIGDTSTPGTITYELYHSKQIIEQKIPGQQIISAAYPYCAYNDSVRNVAAQYYEAARSCGSYVNAPAISGLNWYSLGSADVRFDQPRNSLSDDQDEFDMYTSILQNQTIANGKWTIFLAHEVVPFSQISSGTVSGDYYPVSTEWFTQLCQWIKQKSDSNFVWVETIGNVTRYIKERQNFSYTLISSDNNQIQFNPEDGLDDSIFNYPLTVDVVVPSGWQNVQVSQGITASQVATFSDGTNNYVRIHVIPDGGTVTLTSSTTSFELSGAVTYNNAAESPLANVSVYLSAGGDTLKTVTDASGNYTFLNVNPGTYILTATKSDDWGGVNTTDALMAARYFSNLITLDSLQLKAADVNNNGQVNSTDALMIARRYVNMINSFSKPEWVFSTPITVTITNTSITQNIKGMATGDVNKSYSP